MVRILFVFHLCVVVEALFSIMLTGGGRVVWEKFSNRFFFFFKQKTAYEMRISDWSSDVCSSDLMSGGDLVTADSYGAFDLTLDWKVERGGNSGVFYLARDAPGTRNIYETGIEMQIGRAHV